MNTRKVFIETLGCPKNQIDSEMMLGLLSKNSYEVTDFAEEADIIIINTCGFIESAKEESIFTITEFLQYKLEGSCSIFIVAGCLVERYSEELQKEIPEVDIFIGTTKFPLIVKVIEEMEFSSKTVINIGDIDILIPENIPRVRTKASYTAYLKISEGCDNNCTYCIIPKLRGKYRSRLMEDIVKEAKVLVKSGAKELIIIAQDTIRYGKDIYGKNRLADLLKEICKIEGLEWVRVMYAYPDEINLELIQTFADEDKIVKYIDMPIQHASNTLLKRMNRRTSKEQIAEVMTLFRKHVPNMIIRTTLIVGFPGETENEFNELYEFIKEQKFGRLGVFSYSPQEGTPSAKMKDQIDEEIKEDRKNMILELQQGISYEKNGTFYNQIIDVLVEEKIDDEDVFLGRASFDAPEIDGQVYINTKTKLIAGDIVKVLVSDFMEYDLIGGLADELSK